MFNIREHESSSSLVKIFLPYPFDLSWVSSYLQLKKTRHEEGVKNASTSKKAQKISRCFD